MSDSLVGTTEFFGLLYGSKIPDEYLAITVFLNKIPSSRFFCSLEDTALYSYIAERDQAGCDVYFGVGLLSHKLRHGRGTKEDVCALPGLWLDVDIEGPGHKKGTLFKTESAALEIIKSIGLEPSITVFSGGGLHLYFLFTELLRLRSPAEQTRADLISQNFQKAVRKRAQAIGAEIDMTGDITRILRIPGTSNKKNAQPIQCRVVEVSEARYKPESFFQYQHQQPIGPDRQQKGERKAAVSPSEQDLNKQLQAYLTNAPELKRAFDREDVDQFGGDDSAIDQSLTSKLAHAGASFEVITHALMTSRAKVHDGKAKHTRRDYISRTVETAINGARQVLGTTLSGPSKVSKPSAADIADRILTEYNFAQDAASRVYVYLCGTYSRDGAEFIKQQVHDLVSNKYWTSHLAREVVESVRVRSRTLWECPPLDMLNLLNGLLDVKTRELRPHSPDHLSPIQLPVTFDPTARSTAWDEQIEATFPDDAVLAGTAYQIVAWLMLPELSLQKAVLLLGPGGGGKSTFLAGVRAFLGKANCSTLSVQELEDDRFAPAGLEGKLANICPDLPNTRVIDSSVLKRITGGDGISIQQKYGGRRDADLFVRFIFSANHLLHVSSVVMGDGPSDDDHSAFFDRWNIIEFQHSYRGTSDEIDRETLDAKLSQPRELSGVLNRALEALAMLHGPQRRQLTGVSTWSEVSNNPPRGLDPVVDWLEAHTEPGADFYVSKEALYQLFREHQKARHTTLVISKWAFGNALKSRNAREGQRTLDGRAHVECWLGLRLRPIGAVN